MGLSKTRQFGNSSQQISDFSKILSHPARITILEMLARSETCICGEIVDKLPLAQSTVSQHLKELKKLGIINIEICGQKSCYTINWEQLEKLFGTFRGFENKLRSFSIPA